MLATVVDTSAQHISHWQSIMLKTFVIIILGITISGCAIVLTGVDDKIYFSSYPMGANIKINGVDYGKTPSIITLQRTPLASSAELSLPGYQRQEVPIGSTFNYASLLDVVFWPSFILDLGDLYRYSPLRYDANLIQTEGKYLDNAPDKTSAKGLNSTESSSSGLEETGGAVGATSSSANHPSPARNQDVSKYKVKKIKHKNNPTKGDSPPANTLMQMP